MTLAPTALQADWLGTCRRAVAGLKQLLAETPTTAGRVQETGTRGSGGDRTLVLDSDAEAVVLAELDALSAQGYRFCALSEERGVVDYGDRAVRVIIDPIDGSLNAKRGASHFALSIAVADGATMADVAFAFVHDFGASEQWWASRGEGAWLNGDRLDPSLQERRSRDGKLELLGIESADPRWVADSIGPLVDSAHRLRALGTIAVSLCMVAATRFDGMVTLARSRGVDAAAGQLIVREAGGLVSFTDCEAALGAPLDATPSSHLVAARSPEALRALGRIAA
ncbi:MAG TPA: inositol monophosphatase family protein [Solirubrobacteraceae bacterium]|jgi:myo-inositol-1(or 4)-monophosphatase